MSTKPKPCRSITPSVQVRRASRGSKLPSSTTAHLVQHFTDVGLHFAPSMRSTRWTGAQSARLPSARFSRCHRPPLQARASVFGQGGKPPSFAVLTTRRPASGGPESAAPSFGDASGGGPHVDGGLLGLHDTERVFREKSTSSLAFSLAILDMCSLYQPFSRYGTQVNHISISTFSFPCLLLDVCSLSFSW